ncbi:MAG TPA: FAD-binding protein [candidate division WOR-3 bacterium]|uniref:FAD-binding protein n=1 Tax=candidate division WOR-3 bacterium TaxID=2052148 RepID=A0A7C5DB39_UNCW3|nr:FAD-binding protein [candidate division WOR-3 bacterium]
MKIIVIGGGAAGMSAASKAKRENPDAEVIVYEKDKYFSFGLCGIPYYVAGKVSHLEDLIALKPEQISKRGIEALPFHNVLEIYPHKKYIKVRDIKSSEVVEEHFDRLIIASGSEAIKLEGFTGDGIFYLHTLDDGYRLREFIASENPKTACIVGGGYIGLEMADALNSLGIKVRVIEKMDHILPNFDIDMVEIAESRLLDSGVEIMTGTSVEGVETSPAGKRVYTENNHIDCDFVIVSAGVKPSSELAKKSKIPLGKFGGVLTNNKMETDQFGIFAAGDCIEVKHILTRKNVYIPLGTTANKTGRIAGENAAGGNDNFSGIAGTGIFRSIGFDMSVTGLTERWAKGEGLNAISSTITGLNKAHYMPDKEKLTIKLVFDKNKGKIFGAQMIGRGVERINVIAAAIQGNFTIEDIRRIDFAYSPPFATVWDALLISANRAIKEVV